MTSFEESPHATEPVPIPVPNAAVALMMAEPHPGDGVPADPYVGGSYALALDYPELPSLTVPASIRRWQSSFGLEAQSRVHTLSAIADQNWREVEQNLAHRLGRQRGREQISTSTVQAARAPVHPWRLASLQCVRLAAIDTVPLPSPHACSVPLQPRHALAMQLQEDECTTAADGWHRSGIQRGAMSYSRSQLSMIDTTISPDLMAASAGSECRLGVETRPSSAEPCMITQGEGEANISWANSGSCDLQIGSAPTHFW